MWQIPMCCYIEKPRISVLHLSLGQIQEREIILHLPARLGIIVGCEITSDGSPGKEKSRNQRGEAEDIASRCWLGVNLVIQLVPATSDSNENGEKGGKPGIQIKLVDYSRTEEDKDQIDDCKDDDTHVH